ncbi:MAG: DUF89 family protein [candidate division WS1 bacterium]|jgi:uncharacterized protein with ATP-grasp and redox domains|nr:DUF89 family protein [candidate division WS1 bacterium]
MKAFLDCLPCIARQTLETTRIATSDISLQRAALVKVLGRLAETDGRITPMELGQMGQEVAREVTGCDDPYTQLKEQSNARALELYPRLKEIVEAAEEPLRTATQIAIAGNIIDFGVPHKIDVEGTLERVLGSSFAVDEYDLFAQRLGEAERVFYLADNAGEIVFDRVLMEEMRGAEITVAVKDKPFINDALRADAQAVGVAKLARVVEVPIYPESSPELEREWARADLIVAKGQANYEAYSEAEGPIFFLLLAKCDCVAREAGVRRGDMILQAGPG